VLWRCWFNLVGRREEHPACKKLGVGLLEVTIWLELCTSYSSSCQLPPPLPLSLATTRSSADADNRRDAFSGQSRSTNNRKMHRFWDIQLQKCRDLENRVSGPSRSFEISSFDRAHTTSYWRSIVTMALSRVVWDIQCRKMSWSWNRGQRSLKVIESGISR